MFLEILGDEMKDQDKTKEQLISELVDLRERLAALEALEAERPQFEEALRQRDRELTLLERMGQEFTARLDLQQVIEQLLQAATEIIGAEGASVWLRDESPEGWLVCRMAYHQGQKRTPVDLRLGPGAGIAGWVAEKRESAVVPSVRGDPRFFPGIDEQTGFHTEALLAVPLRTRDRVIGVLEVVNKLEGDFDWKDLTLAETLAALAAIAIDNARLVDTLRQRTVDLQASYKKLDAFSHALTNDLRGPLGLIVSFAQALEEGYAIPSEGDLERYLHTTVQKGNELIEVIDELLLVRTGPPKEIEEAIGPLDMANIVAGALERLDYMIEEHHAEIVLPEQWPTPLGYAPWVEEVWSNYLRNAIRYGARPPHVELGATEQEGGTVRFWVRDNGPGLTPGEQVRLFTPLTRLDRIRDPEYELGLTLARRIVEKLGGQVGVESDVGRGSIFFFTLPVAS